jgi:hypothetical protein
MKFVDKAILTSVDLTSVRKTVDFASHETQFYFSRIRTISRPPGATRERT